MKLKCTNVLVTIAMICSVLAMIMNWIIYFGPQDKYIQSFGGFGINRDDCARGDQPD